KHAKWLIPRWRPHRWNGVGPRSIAVAMTCPAPGHALPARTAATRPVAGPARSGRGMQVEGRSGLPAFDPGDEAVDEVLEELARVLAGHLAVGVHQPLAEVDVDLR